MPEEPDYKTGDISLWAHGPTFDISILAAAYDACGLPIPWHYRAPRDTRTAFDMAGVDDHSAFMQRFNYGTAHNALDDSISQAKAVCAAFRRIRHEPKPMLSMSLIVSNPQIRRIGRLMIRLVVRIMVRHIVHWSNRRTQVESGDNENHYRVPY